MSKQNFVDSVLREEWDDLTRLYTAWDEDGVQTEQRPYNAEENAAADALLVALAEQAAQKAKVAESEAILTAIATTAAPPPSGEAWVQPTGAHDAYPLNATVTHEGKTWLSTVAYNVWEPGVSGWHEQGGVGYPAWTQPTGAHDAYNTGDRVNHNGSDWESTVDANVWEPGVYGWDALPA